MPRMWVFMKQSFIKNNIMRVWLKHGSTQKRQLSIDCKYYKYCKIVGKYSGNREFARYNKNNENNVLSYKQLQALMQCDKKEIFYGFAIHSCSHFTVICALDILCFFSQFFFSFFLFQLFRTFFQGFYVY